MSLSQRMDRVNIDSPSPPESLETRISNAIRELVNLVERVILSQEIDVQVKTSVQQIQRQAEIIHSCWTYKNREKELDYENQMIGAAAQISVLQQDIAENEQRLQNDPFTLDLNNAVVKNAIRTQLQRCSLSKMPLEHWQGQLTRADTDLQTLRTRRDAMADTIQTKMVRRIALGQFISQMRRVRAQGEAAKQLQQEAKADIQEKQKRLRLQKHQDQIRLLQTQDEMDMIEFDEQYGDQTEYKDEARSGSDREYNYKDDGEDEQEDD